VNRGRYILASVEQKHPADPAVRAFVQGKQLDAMLQSALFKEISL
jgi:hypothetical protein